MKNGKRLIAIAMIVIAAAVIGATTWTISPAFAHGGEEGEEVDPVNLVEQALAIVINTPAKADEALERVEAALAAEAEEPTGELDIAAVEAAAEALETDDLHEAEDALVAALGSDPHASVDEPVRESASKSEGDHTEEGPGNSDVVAHGPTERVDGGFSAPSRTDIAALAAAAALAAGGFAFVYSKKRGNS